MAVAGPRLTRANELIEALEQCNWAYGKKLIHSQPQLLSSTNKMGYTPLMLLAMATWPSTATIADDAEPEKQRQRGVDLEEVLEHGNRANRTNWKTRQAKHREYKARLPSELLEVMLEHGAARTAAEKANHMTAADYAQESGKQELADLLRALERPDLDCTCSLCGERLERRNQVVKTAERVASGEEANVAICNFFSDDEWLETRKKLADPLFHAVTHKHYPFCKELSETMAVVNLLVPHVSATSCNMHIIDFCCGRSLTAAVSALKFGGCPVTAVDCMKENMLPHYSHAGLDVTYLRHDIFSHDFTDSLRSRVMAVGLPTVLLGVHCCGFLSSAAIEAFKRIDLIEALFLMPCCLPSKRDPRSPKQLFMTKDPDEQYREWVTYLQNSVGINASLRMDHDVLSVKSAIIIANKSDAVSERLNE